MMFKFNEIFSHRCDDGARLESKKSKEMETFARCLVISRSTCDNRKRYKDHFIKSKSPESADAPDRNVAYP
jgi:hypothetical protein